MKSVISKASIVAVCFCLLFSLTSCFGKNDSGKDVPTTTREGVNFAVVKAEEKGVVKFETNLPENTKLKIRVGNKSKEYDKTLSAKVVADGNKKYIVSEQFLTDKKTDLTDGNYVVVATTELPSKQPSDVVKTIGDKGQKLKGANVYASGKEYIAKVTKGLSVKDGFFVEQS